MAVGCSKDDSEITGTSETTDTSDDSDDSNVDMAASDRAALIDFYNATDGDNWIDNNNWCTDESLSDWAGVGVDNTGRVTSLSFSEENLNGNIPESLCSLTALTNLYIWNCNELTGSIPDAIGDLVNLTSLTISGDNLTGSIPSTMGNLINLTYLYIGACSYSLTTGYGTGQMSGEIPDIFGNMDQLSSLEIAHAQFSGSLPASMGTLTNLVDLNLNFN